MEHLFQINSVGLIYDVVGVVILGFAFFSKSIKAMMVESGTYFDGNNALLESLIQTRTDGVTGTVFLVAGFFLQWFGSFGVNCNFVGEISFFFLVVALFTYVLFLRKKLISLQVSRGVDLRQQQKT